MINVDNPSIQSEYRTATTGSLYPINEEPYFIADRILTLFDIFAQARRMGLLTLEQLVIGDDKIYVDSNAPRTWFDYPLFKIAIQNVIDAKPYDGINVRLYTNVIAATTDPLRRILLSITGEAVNCVHKGENLMDMMDLLYSHVPLHRWYDVKALVNRHCS